MRHVQVLQTVNRDLEIFQTQSATRRLRFFIKKQSEQMKLFKLPPMNNFTCVLKRKLCGFYWHESHCANSAGSIGQTFAASSLFILAGLVSTLFSVSIFLI